MNQSLGLALLTSWAAETNRYYRGEPYSVGLRRLRRVALSIIALLLFLAGRALAQVTGDAPISGRPVAIVGLATREGAELVNAQWRYSDVRIVMFPVPAASGSYPQPANTWGQSSALSIRIISLLATKTVSRSTSAQRRAFLEFA